MTNKEYKQAMQAAGYREKFALENGVAQLVTVNGDIIDIITTECRKSELKRKIHIYAYLDVYSDYYTSKRTIDIDKIYDALK